MRKALTYPADKAWKFPLSLHSSSCAAITTFNGTIRSCRLIKASDRQESQPDVSLTGLTVLLTASAHALNNTGKRGGELSFAQKSEHPIFFLLFTRGDAYSSELIYFHKWLHHEFHPAILSVPSHDENSKGHGLAEGTFGYSSTAGSNCWQDQSSSVSKWSTRAQIFTGWLVKFFLSSYWRAILSKKTPSLPRIERVELRLPPNIRKPKTWRDKTSSISYRD